MAGVGSGPDLSVGEGPGDAESARADGHDRSFFERRPMSLDQLGHQSDPLRHRNVRQPNQPRVRLVVEVDQLTEVGIHADQDPVLAVRELEERPVSRIGSELPSFNNIVALSPKPVGEHPAGAAVNQESQASATETVASVSRAITARA